MTDLTENTSPSRLAGSMKNLAANRRFVHKLTRKARHPDFSSLFSIGGLMASEMFVGIDVASRELVISSPQGLTTITNTQAAIEAWLMGLPAGSHIGVEATSHYHELVADRAVLAGMVVYVLNPRDTRHYMLGLGRRSKTDRVDAGMIQRLILAEHAQLRPYQPAAAVHRQLALLQRRRGSVVGHRQALHKALRQIGILATVLDQTLAALDTLIAQIDQQLDTLLNSQEGLAKEARRLETVPGIGRQTSTQLVTLFKRVDLANSDAAVAFVGLDPRACDSGQKSGRRRLSKRGSAELRRLLYNCAQAAARTVAWKPYYAQLKSGKFSTTQALVIIARKLLRIAFSLWQQPGILFNAQKVACLGLTG
ncbi:transposase [Methyloglobulus morosus]|nr:transposase [Methyloglobulus morosus]